MFGNTYLLVSSMVISAALLTSACGDGHGDHCTSVEEAMCSGTQIRLCDGAHFGEAQDCPEGQECMTMESGLTHCMLSSMMGHDDHEGMDMGDDAHEGMDHAEHDDSHSDGM